MNGWGMFRRRDMPTAGASENAGGA